MQTLFLNWLYNLLLNCLRNIGFVLVLVPVEIYLNLTKLINMLFFRSCLKETGTVPNVDAKFVQMPSTTKNLHNFWGL